MRKMLFLLILCTLVCTCGCQDKYVRVILENTTEPMLKVNIVSEGDALKAKELLDDNFTRFELDGYKDSLFGYTIYIYDVLSQHVKDKLKLDFADGIFLVRNNNTEYTGVNKTHLDTYRADGHRTVIAEEDYFHHSFEVPMERTEDPSTIEGIAIMYYDFSFIQVLNLFNIFHDASDDARCYYLPVRQVKKIGDDRYVLEVNYRPMTWSYVGDGPIMLGIINCNSTKSMKAVTERAKNPGIMDSEHDSSYFLYK